MSKIKQKLQQLRELMEADAGEPISAIGEQPVTLVLADVCAALGVEGQEQREVLGDAGAQQVEGWRMTPVQYVGTNGARR